MLTLKFTKKFWLNQFSMDYKDSKLPCLKSLVWFLKISLLSLYAFMRWTLKNLTKQLSLTLLRLQKNLQVIAINLCLSLLIRILKRLFRWRKFSQLLMLNRCQLIKLILSVIRMRSKWSKTVISSMNLNCENFEFKNQSQFEWIISSHQRY